MVFEDGRILDDQIEDGDPENATSETYLRFIKAGRVVGKVASKIVTLPIRVNKGIIHFVDELDRATGRY